MTILLVVLLVVAVIAGPSAWVWWTLRRHSTERDDFPGTGGQFAAHLIERLGIEGVGVEATEKGDHYDPEDRCVRLDKRHFERKSLAAVTVAAHEVGHAIQHATGYKPLEARHKLATIAFGARRVAGVLLVVLPIIVMITKSPVAGALMFLAGLTSVGIATIMHLITLPVEFDASFNRALPILEKGQYIPEADMPAAQQILRAAALTYVAGALLNLLNVWAWLRALR